MSSDSQSNRPKITLHWLERSRSQRILWLLEELGLPYDIETYKRDPATEVAPPELMEVHPLGKSPVLTIGAHAVAESALIVEYLCEHFRPALIPSKWKDGCEGALGGETEEYMRYRYFMHYAEGSLMALVQVALVSNVFPAPFFIRPITSQISGKINQGFVDPGLTTHFKFLEEQLASAPDGGPYLCGATLTGADIMMSFPVIVLTGGMGERGPAYLTKEVFPRVFAYAEVLKAIPSYQRAVDRIVALEGEYKIV
ncbi:glutathione S-transferase-like protein [Mycena polygramma]|nr:glutathione S-transferase-like protein [Mycena polygramma]